MVRGLVASAALVMLASSLAGCALLPGGSGLNGNLVRIVDLSFNPEAFEDEPEDLADLLSALGETRFEYTHDASDVDPSEVTVTYTDDSGREREDPLSEFTSATTLAKGDKVTIPGVLMTSQVKIAKGGDTLASRGDDLVEWLEAGGYPLPLAAKSGARAVWSLSGGIEANGELDHAEVRSTSEEEEFRCIPVKNATGVVISPGCGDHDVTIHETGRIDDASASASTSADAEFSITSSGRSGDQEVVFAVDGQVDLSLFFEASVFASSLGYHEPDDNETYEAVVGADLDASLDGEGAITLRFDEGALVAAGAEGEFATSGSFKVWDDEHARSEGYEPFELGEASGSSDYVEEEIDLGDEAIDFAANALSDLWRMDLEAGDEFRFASGDLGADLPSATYVVRVVGQEELKVPAGTFDTFRVQTTTTLQIPLEGKAPQTFEIPGTTTWIDARSGLPVASETTLAVDYTKEDFQPLLDLAQELADEEGVEIDFPTILSFSLAGTPRMELTEWDSGLRMPPVAGVLGPLWGFALGAFGSGVVSGLNGYDDDYYEYEYDEAPSLQMSVQVIGQQGGAQVSIVQVASGVMWQEMSFSSDLDCAVPSTGYVAAGQQVQCTGPAGDHFLTINYVPMSVYGGSSYRFTTIFDGDVTTT